MRLNRLRFQTLFVLTVFIGGSLATPQSAVGQTTASSTRLAVVGLRADGNVFDDGFRKDLSDRVSSRRGLELVPEAATGALVADLWQTEIQTSKEKVRVAREYFIEGKKKYDQLALDEAIKQFNRSVIEYREGIGALKDNRYLLVSHLYLGMALVVMGRQQEGERYIQEMIVLDPKRNSRKLSAREFSPKVLEIHKALTDKVLRGPIGQLSLGVEPWDAEVYIDGVREHLTPGKNIELPVGEHFVMVEKQGYRQQAQRLMVNAGANQLNVSLQEWRPFSPVVPQQRNNLIAQEELIRVAEKLSAHVLLLGSVTPIVDKGEYLFSGQWFDTRSREYSKIVDVTYPSTKYSQAARALARELQNHLTPQGLVVADLRAPAATDASFQRIQLPDRPLQRAPVQRQRDSSAPVFYQKPWFWGVVGAVVLGGAGAYLLATQTGSTPDYNVLRITPVR